MAKPKLDLYSKTDGELEQFAQTHQVKMLNNPAFTNPAPTAVEFTNALGEFAFCVDEVEKADVAYQAAISRKNQVREELMTVLTQRGSYVSHTSKGDPTLILSAGFEVVDTNRNPLDVAAPANLTVTLGDGTGVIDLAWNASPGARAYLIECRINDETLPWQQAAVTTRSRATIPNLQSAKSYAFRVKAIGPKGDSPWSTVVVILVA